VRVLDEKPLTFTQLMVETGIDDSSLLNFHLKKLQNLVERWEGHYRLTEDGTRVYEILKSLRQVDSGDSVKITQPIIQRGEITDRLCRSCGKDIDVLADVCPYCHTRQNRMVVSWLWYLVPFFLLWLGGLVAWFVNKEIDPRRARNILIFGFVWTPIALVVFFLILIVL
jgi:hypothetical protein